MSDKAASPLATDDQLALERLALRVEASPEVRRAREQVRAAQMLPDITAGTLDGAAGLDRALDQWVMGQVVATINADPSRPKLMWAVDNTPRQWFGQIFPGAAVAIDNPDNVNRTGPLHGDWDYVLEGRFGDPAAAQTSINVTLAEHGQLRIGDPIATLTDRDIEADNQGRFSITMDRTPAGDRKNHIQLVDVPLQIAIRDSHSDWRQQPTAFSLRVVKGPEPREPLSEKALAQQAADGLESFVKFWLGFKNNFWNSPQPNTLVGPLERKQEGNWGTQAGGRFNLTENQALVITTRDGGADYTGFQVSDPWTISPTPVYRTTSRNLSQSTLNPDGSYSYVIALVDPGAANWIDTACLHEGWFMLRWQNLPPGADIPGLVQDINLVDLTQLDTVLPKGSPRIDIGGRRDEILDRIASHKIRTKSA